MRAADLSPAQDAAQTVDMVAGVRHSTLNGPGGVQADRAELALLVLRHIVYTLHTCQQNTKPYSPVSL